MQGQRRQARLGCLSPAAFRQQYFQPKTAALDTVLAYTNSDRPYLSLWLKTHSDLDEPIDTVKHVNPAVATECCNSAAEALTTIVVTYR
jgi:hypothetical protein